ncbi:hypothetical protein [Burkholderia sp. A1]|uniref:hypothetical protein n=1 Tax=Burkholderia sp. A1 TaxID=148446 RepID=UPI00046A5454|nr:hypothetical protein [Burkholderia sp. A1]
MNRYRIEVGAALLAYVALLTVSLLLLRGDGIESRGWRILASLLPILPGVGVCWAIVRRVRRLDELQRRIELESLSIAFGGTALLTFGYGFLENVGFPSLSLFVVWPVMAVLWVLSSVFVSLRYR